MYQPILLMSITLLLKDVNFFVNCNVLMSNDQLCYCKNVVFFYSYSLVVLQLGTVGG